MTTNERVIVFVKGVVPTAVFAGIWAMSSGGGFGIVIALVIFGSSAYAAARRAGLIEQRSIRGRIDTSTGLGRQRADEILGQTDPPPPTPKSPPQPPPPDPTQRRD